jgi:hypothetical protein
MQGMTREQTAKIEEQLEMIDDRLAAADEYVK